MELAAIILSALSLVVAIVGTSLANRRAREALEESRKAATNALWSDLQAAVQRFIGFDPASEPVGDRLTNLRITAIALVDHMDDWTGLDTWLEAERQLGAVLARQVMELRRANDTMDQRLANLEPYQLWAQALSINLRRFRTTGFDVKVAARLRELAEQAINDVSRQNGWEPPPVTPSGLHPLDM